MDPCPQIWRGLKMNLCPQSSWNPESPWDASLSLNLQNSIPHVFLHVKSAPLLPPIKIWIPSKICLWISFSHHIHFCPQVVFSYHLVIFYPSLFSSRNLLFQKSRVSHILIHAEGPVCQARFSILQVHSLIKSWPLPCGTGWSVCTVLHLRPSQAPGSPLFHVPGQ